MRISLWYLFGEISRKGKVQQKTKENSQKTRGKTARKAKVLKVPPAKINLIQGTCEVVAVQKRKSWLN